MGIEYSPLFTQIPESRASPGGRARTGRRRRAERGSQEISIHPRIPCVQPGTRDGEAGTGEERETVGRGTEHCHAGCRTETEVSGTPLNVLNYPSVSVVLAARLAYLTTLI